MGHTRNQYESLTFNTGLWNIFKKTLHKGRLPKKKLIIKVEFSMEPWLPPPSVENN